LLGSRKVLEDADHVICVGENELTGARQNLGHDRISFLPNGVDPEKFSQGGGSAFRAKHGIPQDSLLVLCLSRIDAQKNQMLLLKAFATLRGNRPTARLLLIGPETQPVYAENLRMFVRQSGLERSVLILPGLRHNDPDRFAAYDACDVFVLPSVHEPFGIVVLEAWCAGKPVIAARVGGLSSLIEEGRTGLFAGSTQDPADLAGKLARLADDAPLRARLGNEGREEARRKYTWDAVNSKLDAIYCLAENYARSRR
jgi:glycosyltransferase involved in cell wall biosynthesis